MSGSGDAPKILCVASAGGHWVQLQRLRPAWDGCQVTYVTTQSGYEAQVAADAAARGQAAPRLHVVVEASRWQKLRLLRQLAQIAWIILRLRPQVVLTTGAAPGYFALLLGRRFGARTIWVDSIANADELSASGAQARRHADLWLTQWEHLARPEGPAFAGAVL